MSTFKVLLLLTLYGIQIILSQNITESIENLTDELKTLFCDGLSIGNTKCNDQSYGVQEFIDSFSNFYDSDLEDVSIISEQIIDNLNSKLNVRASFLTNMTAKIQSTCNTYGYTDFSSSEYITGFDDLKFSGNGDRAAKLPSDIAYSSVYGNAVSLSSTTYKLPNNVDYDDEYVTKDAQLSELLEDTMLDLHDKYCIDISGNDEYCSMYFGTINGVFRQYPGVENVQNADGSYPNYDPRFRPWYVSAATGSKDVVILIDRSGSMGKHNRMTLAKSAVVSVLSTLGQSSFVSVVAFNSESELSCFGDELVPATARNVAELISFVEGLQAGGGTNFEAAFNSAFTILEGGAKSCQTSILFLTDGMSDDPSSIITSRNTDDIGAVIFSYTLGAAANDEIPRKVASSTNGIYTHINDDDENLITKMSSYYLYYAYGGSDDNNIILTSPYLDFDTGVAMITMAMSVYVQDEYFVGVVGIDIPLSFLSDAIGNIVIGRKSYSFVVNQESEAILHPLIPDPLTTLFSDGDGYNAVYIKDLEPNAFDTTLLTSRSSGSIKIEATVKQPAGDVSYNGYIEEAANLLYIYSGVGPSSLSFAIVIFTESDISAPNVQGFGLEGSPSNVCDNSTLPSNCRSSYALYHDLTRMQECQSSWIAEAGIVHSSRVSGHEYINDSISLKYPSFYLQPGSWLSSTDAINVEIQCDELEALHNFANQRGTVSSHELPFGGIRSEISTKIANTIYTMTSMAEFWKSAYSAPNSTFFWLYFGSYQGLSVTYPAAKYNPTFNALKRPWYRRAITYPDLLVFTTPYFDAITGVLVASGATTMTAPKSTYPYGVAAFDYAFNDFLTYWDNIMSDICDQTKNQYCYLIDSSAFLLWYDGINYDVNDDDISIKFFGDLEPTLMQSLLDKGFFINETNTNYLDETIDISYVTDNYILEEENLDTMATSFSYNNGKYTVHRVSGTNLYVIYIINYSKSQTYPTSCPTTRCMDVQSPGCIKITSTDQCKSSIVDVCIEPDEPTIIENIVACSVIDTFGICVLKTDSNSDMCASNFAVDGCGPDHAFKASPSWIVQITTCLIFFSVFKLF